MTRYLIVAIIVAFAIPATADDTQSASDHFQDGVKRYEQKDWGGASAAFEKSYRLKPDSKTLFAWAQSERFAKRCAHSIELFTKLLEEQLTTDNRAVVQTNITECERVISDEKAKAEEAAKAAEAARAAKAREAVIVPPTPPVPNKPQPEIRAERRPWYREPLGVTLVGAGAVSLAVGVGYYVKATSTDKSADDAATFADFVEGKQQARRQSQIGIIVGAGGAALLGAGIAYYLLRSDRPDSVAITASASSAFVTWNGRF